MPDKRFSGNQEYIDSLTEAQKQPGTVHWYAQTVGKTMVLANHYDVTDLISTVTWSGSKTDVARKLQLTLVSNNSYYYPKFKIEMHNLIEFFEDGKALFRGYVMDIDRNLDSETITYTAYDAGVFLARSKANYKIIGMTPDAVCAMICKDFKIQPGNFEAGAPYTRIHENDTLYDIIMTAYTYQSDNNGVQYYAHMDGTGKLNVSRKGALEFEYVLTDQREITGANFKASSSDSVNRVKILDKDGNDAGTVQLDNAADFPGILQDVYKEQEGYDSQASAKLMLKDVALTATLDCIGETGCITGCAVLVDEPVTGLQGLFYVDADTHQWAGGQHTMNLTLAFQNVMDRKTAGTELQESPLGTVDAEPGTGSNEERMYNYLRKSGLSAAAACAMIGYSEWESNHCNPTQQQIGGPAWGLFQWEEPRLSNMRNWCSKKNFDSNSIEGQCAYAVYELDGGDPTCAALMRSLYGTTPAQWKVMEDVSQATIIFNRCFGRGGIPRNETKIQYATEFYNKWHTYLQIPTASPESGGTPSAMAGDSWGWPLAGGAGTVTQNFSPACSYRSQCSAHRGMDISSAHGYAQGSPIVAINSGTVASVQHWNGTVYGDQSWGNCVVINHGNGIYSRYAHMWQGSICVNVGDKVAKGQKLGIEGLSGNVTGTHLHIEVLKGGIYGQLLDPAGYIRR